MTRSIQYALRTGDLGRLADDLTESQARLEQRPPERASTMRRPLSDSPAS